MARSMVRTSLSCLCAALGFDFIAVTSTRRCALCNARSRVSQCIIIGQGIRGELSFDQVRARPMRHIACTVDMRPSRYRVQ